MKVDCDSVMHTTNNSHCSLAPARIISFSSDVFHPQSQSLSLPCHSVGNPPPQLSWIHENKLLRNSAENQVLSDGALLIRQVKGDLEGLTCQVENIHGRDKISYSIRMVKSPAAPTIRVSKITANSITLAWNLPHNGGALIQGKMETVVANKALLPRNLSSIYPNSFLSRLFSEY